MNTQMLKRISTWYLTMDMPDRKIGGIKNIPVDFQCTVSDPGPASSTSKWIRPSYHAEAIVLVDKSIPAAAQMWHAYACKASFKSVTISWGDRALPSYSIELSDAVITDMRYVDRVVNNQGKM